MEGMKTFPDKFFDLAITDPPYKIGESNSDFNSRNTPIKQKGGNYLNAPNRNYTRKKWDYLSPDANYFIELLRVTKQQIIWGVNYYDYLLSGGRIIWDKCNGNNDFSDCEIAYCSIHKSVRLFRYMWAGMFQGKSITEGHIQQGNKKLNQKKIHPTEKPIALYKWLLQKYAKPDFKILDTHAGSCSSVIAFLDYGCDWIAFEIDKDYYEAANKRIEIHKKQLKLNYEMVPED